MSKIRTKYVCSECGYESSGWLGKCPSCLKWNTLVEEVDEAGQVSDARAALKDLPPAIQLSDVDAAEGFRVSTGSAELDRVLGGGIVPASMVLVGGDPGIGKSTLILQVCSNISSKKRVLYISGEESIGQIKLRADRIGLECNRLYMLSETCLERIEAVLERDKPELAVIDSIQTMYSEKLNSAPGSVSQVREVTGSLLRIAKKLGITVFIVGHVTKEGAIAGPRVLEHMVDTVLYFEGDRRQDYRILRAVKNRFGSTNEIGLFEMGDKGLADVQNPSSIMLEGRNENQPGSVVAGLIEGTRSMLVEVQALVCPTSFGMPRRMATGLDYNRLAMLMAVLEKKVGMQLHSFDAYLNAAGGLRIEETAADLAVVAAIASSFRNMPVSHDTVLFGEVGLTGEVRAVGQSEKRLSECARLGFRRCVMPAGSARSVRDNHGLEILPVNTIDEMLQILF
ncbi:MAG TPA: DNA repair protein RadA [Thermoclostridium sp.]|nr:DNA repair protein RadA [Clostridiaceae bacterium]HOQ75624.1 DNA repair protein RadA [Thermoclostridium sp.]